MQITKLFIRGSQMGLSQRWRCDEAEVRVMTLLKVKHKPKHARDLWKLEQQRLDCPLIYGRNAALQKPSFWNCGLHNCTIIHFHCLKPLGFWELTAATGNIHLE